MEGKDRSQNNIKKETHHQVILPNFLASNFLGSALLSRHQSWLKEEGNIILNLFKCVFFFFSSVPVYSPIRCGLSSIFFFIFFKFHLDIPLAISCFSNEHFFIFPRKNQQNKQGRVSHNSHVAASSNNREPLHV